mmetsp:Transcript_47817/g.74634  ORF Transcript_47817/g.74634 Transcript_47817/m.74634 type:complete len:290 (+) Transcript_47817:228-1097(+)
MLKYHTLLQYVVNAQSCVLAHWDGNLSEHHPAIKELRRSWALLEVILALEDMSKKEIKMLVSEIQNKAAFHDSSHGRSLSVNQRAAKKALARERLREEQRVAERKVLARKNEIHEKMMKLELDEQLAVDRGSKYWHKLLTETLELERKDTAWDVKLTADEHRKIEKKEWFREMWQLAYNHENPQEEIDLRHPKQGQVVVMEGERRPATFNMLTNQGIGVYRKHRSRKYSNPRMRYRHKYHDMVIRERGSKPKMRSQGQTQYSGEATGVNPKARHSSTLDFAKAGVNKLH